MSNSFMLHLLNLMGLVLVFFFFLFSSIFLFFFFFFLTFFYVLLNKKQQLLFLFRCLFVLLFFFCLPCYDNDQIEQCSSVWVGNLVFYVQSTSMWSDWTMQKCLGRWLGVLCPVNQYGYIRAKKCSHCSRISAGGSVLISSCSACLEEIFFKVLKGVTCHCLINKVPSRFWFRDPHPHSTPKYHHPGSGGGGGEGGGGKKGVEEKGSVMC